MVLDLNVLNRYVDDGLLRMGLHSEYPLRIYKYTEHCQYSKQWDDVTRMCRGLIVDHTGKVVARPFPKFFNYGELDSASIPNLSFDVYEKYDGSLGILFYYDGKWNISTVGSFHSTQAYTAMGILHDKYPHALPKLNVEYTYLVEIVYPENQIVVKYDDTFLVLLAVINTETGDELDIKTVDVGLPIAKVYDGVNDYHILKDMVGTNQEGFVIKFSNNFRMKVKGDEYIRLHILRTQLTNVMIWESLRDGMMQSLVEIIPDEYHDIVRTYVDGINSQFNYISTAINTAYQSIPPFEHQRDYALYVLEHHPSISSALFNLRKGVSIEHIVWNMVKPLITVSILQLKNV